MMCFFDFQLWQFGSYGQPQLSGNHQVSRLKSHLRHHFLGNHLSVLKGDADQPGAAGVVSSHNGRQSQVLKTAQHVPFTGAALRPDFVLFLPDHGEL